MAYIGIAIGLPSNAKQNKQHNKITTETGVGEASALRTWTL
jgi:hypothetical protein